MSDPVRENQDDAFACLRALAGADGFASTRIDTHANVVLIGERRVYKIKRAVRYPFLDYSTIALRYRYCASEVVLNRRTAPDLYLGIIPLLRKSDGSIRSGAMIESPDPNISPDTDENAVDWAVVMRRFDADGLFDRMAERGQLTTLHLLDLGSRIADFHSKAEQVKNDWRQLKKDVLADNLAELAVADWLSPDAIERHGQDCASVLNEIAGSLTERAANGYVRQCHGDIHLRNIVLIDGRATLFDCIEFSNDFAQIDCLYDLAFLLMDLEHRGMPDAACRVLNRYLETTDDYGGLGLLPFYTALRAQVRAKIEVATVGFAENDGAAKSHRREAEAYFKLACRAIDRPPPRLIAFGGPSGSGKSTLAMSVADHMAKQWGSAVIVLRSDAIRKSMWGVPESQKLPPEAYSPKISRQVYAYMHRQAETALRHGMPVLLDATHTHPDSRRAAANIALNLRIPFQGLWATAPANVLINRVTARRNDASDADADIVRMQLRQDWGAMDWSEVDTSLRLDGMNEAATSTRQAIQVLGLDSLHA